MKLIYRMQNSSLLKKFFEIAIKIIVFVYSFSIPSFGENGSKLSIIVYLSMSLLFLFTVLYCFLYSNFRLNSYSLLVPLFALFAFAGTVYYSHEYRRWFSLVLLSISFISFLFAFQIINDKFIIIKIVLSALFCFLCFYIIHYRNELIHFSDFASGKFRLGSYFDNPNGVGIVATIEFALSLYLIFFYRSKKRFAYLIPLFASVVVGVSTGSRSFIVSIFILTVIYLFFVFKNHKLLYLAVVLISIGVFIGFLQFPFMFTVKKRLVDSLGTFFGFGSKIDTSTVSRTIWFDFGIYLGLKNALIGYGADGFYTISGIGTYAHNNIAEVFCDFGFIGLVIFYLPMFVLLFYCLCKKDIEKPIIFSLVIYFIFSGFSTVFYYKKFYYLILGFLFYLAFFAVDNRNKNRIKQIKKVIFTCDTMQSGGAERVISILANEFCSMGVDTAIVGVSDKTGRKPFYQINDSVKYVPLNDKKQLKYLRRVLKLRLLLKNEKPDVVVSFLPHINVYTSFALLGTHILHIVSERNDPFNNPTNPLLRVLKRMSFAYADGCVFQTKEERDFYKESIKSKGIVITNPYRFDFQPAKHKKKNNILLSVGRLTEQKNQEMLIKCFARLNSHYNNKYTLRIYGKGPLEQALKELVEELRISNNVEFLGVDSGWRTKEFDDAAFILSSNFEGMPNSLVEALLMGVPCVSTDCSGGGPRDLIQKGFNLRLAPIDNETEMEKAIVETLDKYGDDFDIDNMNNSFVFDSHTIANQWLYFFKGLI